MLRQARSLLSPVRHLCKPRVALRTRRFLSVEPLAQAGATIPSAVPAQKAPPPVSTPASSSQTATSDAAPALKPIEGKNITLEQTLWIGNLAPRTTEDAIKAFFQPFGEVAEVRLVQTADGISRGCAFIDFAKPRVVLGIIKGSRVAPLYLDGSKLSVGVPHSQLRPTTGDESSNTLYIDNLPFSTTVEQLKKLFAPYGVSRPTMCFNGMGNFTGGAYVKFTSREAAESALEDGSKMTFTLDGSTLKVVTAEQGLPSQNAPSKTLYVGNLPASTKYLELRALFKPFGLSKQVALPRTATGRKQLRGFGFIEFESEEVSENILNAHKTEPFVYNGRTLKLAKALPFIPQLAERAKQRKAFINLQSPPPPPTLNSIPPAATA